MKHAQIEFSLVAGGPFYRGLQRACLVRPNRFWPTAPAVAVAIGAWLPLMAIALARRVATGTFDPIILDLSVHTRMLVAIPLLFAAESALEFHGDLAIKRFRRGDFSADTPGAVERALEKAVRRRDSTGPELGLMLATWGFTAAEFLGSGLPPGWVHGVVQVRGMSSVWLWYGLVAIPLFQFLLGRWMWRWIIWTLVLVDLSRLKLRLMPTHPDHGGGILHLSAPIAAFAVFALAMSSVVAAAWYMNVDLGYARAAKFLPPLIVFVLAAQVLAFAPLLAFTSNLNRARRDGVTEYSLVALQLTRAFNDRWVKNPPPGESILDRSDVSELTDLMSSYAGLEAMRVVLFNPRATIAVTLAVLIPMLPVASTELPLPELLAKVMRALLT
jgi:hypothetical protein